MRVGVHLRLSSKLRPSITATFMHVWRWSNVPLQHHPFPLSLTWMLFSHGSLCRMPHASCLLCLCVFFVFGSSQQISEEASGVCLQPRFLGLLFFFCFCTVWALCTLDCDYLNFLTCMYPTGTSGPLNIFLALGHFVPMNKSWRWHNVNAILTITFRSSFSSYSMCTALSVYECISK